MEQRINLITLGVSDFKKSLHFYSEGLGWKPSSASQDDVAFFQMGGVVLSLYPKTALAEDAKVNSNGNGFPGFSLAYNAKSEKEVEDVLSAVKQMGATILKPAEKVFWGGYSGYFSDPDGYLWEVAYNPFFKFDENDNLILP